MTLSMNRENNRGITFRDQEHEMFYRNFLPKCKRQDVYHKALMYCLGISGDTRRNIERIFDFSKGSVKPKCLEEGWIRKCVDIALKAEQPEQTQNRTKQHDIDR